MKFKVGDIVRCIDDGGKPIIRNGQTYVVSVAYSEGDGDDYVRVEGMHSSFFQRRFELATTIIEDTRSYLEAITHESV